MSKRSDVELELINEFKKFDLTRQRSQDSVPPSRFKIKAAKQDNFKPKVFQQFSKLKKIRV